MANDKMAESCLTCKFYFPTPKGSYGDCRRMPPNGTTEGHPTTNPGGWCGEYREDALKLKAQEK